MPILSKASLRAQAWSRGAKTTQRSGTGPEQALEAIKPSLAHSANADPPPSFPASAGPNPRSPITTTHLFNDNYFSSWATIKPSPYRNRPSSKPAAAGPGRSEHRNVDILSPLARQRESPAGPNVPCERRTDPAEPPPRHGSPAPAQPLRHRKKGQICVHRTGPAEPAF